MTHNIQIGINVDDDSIVRGVHEAAVHEIQKGLFGHAITISSCPSYEFSRQFVNGVLHDWMDEVFKDEQLKEKIARYTAEIFADKLMHSSKFRNDVKDKIGGEA